MLISLAGLTVEVLPRYPELTALCREYLAPPGSAPVLSVSVTEEEILAEGTPGDDFSKGYLETLAIYRKLCERLLPHGRLLLHGSAFAFDGEGVLFTAPSGTGKSTHARLWREVYRERVTVINDDKPLLTVRDGGVSVSGTPWDGKHRLSTNLTVPLRAIVLLGRGQENVLVPVTPARAYPYLLGQTYRPSDPGLLALTLSLLDRAMPHLSLYMMRATLSEDAARVACRGIFGDSADTVEGAGR